MDAPVRFPQCALDARGARIAYEHDVLRFKAPHLGQRRRYPLCVGTRVPQRLIATRTAVVAYDDANLSTAAIGLELQNLLAKPSACAHRVSVL
jgi:hypothetical protein